MGPGGANNNNGGLTINGLPKGVTYEPSVEAGKVFTQMSAIGGSQDDVFDTAEADPSSDSVSRGTRQQRSALVVVSESGHFAEAATVRCCYLYFLPYHD